MFTIVVALKLTEISLESASSIKSKFGNDVGEKPGGFPELSKRTFTRDFFKILKSALYIKQ